MTYTIFEHRHRFAVWAAARAVQRGWKNAKALPLRNSIEQCGIKKFLREPSSLETDPQNFEKLHQQWCVSIQNYLRDKGLKTSYGRVAKILAVYIKAMVIVAGAEQSPLAKVAHPPIDRILLQRLSISYNLTSLRDYSWTLLNLDDYYALVKVLRELIPPDQPFWTIEEHWIVANNEVESSEKTEAQIVRGSSLINNKTGKNSELIPPIEKSQLLLCSGDASPESQRKVPGEAGYFYPRASWVGAVRNSSEKLGCDFSILTTGYGMVNSWDIIRPYDKHIDIYPEEVRENFERTIIPWLERKKYKLLLFYGGGVPRDSYLRMLHPIIKPFGVWILTFGRPAMRDVGKIDKIVDMLTDGTDTKLYDIRSILKVPDRLKLLKK